MNMKTYVCLLTLLCLPLFTSQATVQIIPNANAVQSAETPKNQIPALLYSGQNIIHSLSNAFWRYGLQQSDDTLEHALQNALRNLLEAGAVLDTVPENFNSPAVITKVKGDQLSAKITALLSKVEPAEHFIMITGPLNGILCQKTTVFGGGESYYFFSSNHTFNSGRGSSAFMKDTLDEALKEIADRYVDIAKEYQLRIIKIDSLGEIELVNP